jgi:hypothetical protein
MMISRKHVFIAVFAVIVLALWALGADAAYRIVLRNGTEFVVETYEKSGNEVRAEYQGGVIGIPANDIKKIQRISAPAPKKEADTKGGGDVKAGPFGPAPAPSVPPARSSFLHDQLAEVNARIRELERQRDAVHADRTAVAGRLASLEKEGKEKAAANLQDPLVKWREYLLPEDRLWLSQNENAVAGFDEKISRINDALVPLYRDRDYYADRLRGEL